MIVLQLEVKHDLVPNSGPSSGGMAPVISVRAQIERAVRWAAQDRASEGGVARAKKLTADEKFSISSKAAKTRWSHLPVDDAARARRDRRAAQARARRRSRTP